MNVRNETIRILTVQIELTEDKEMKKRLVEELNRLLEDKAE